MTEKKELLTMLAETYIHPGAGQSTSHVDLPVSRERITDYPFISSTSLKGALRSEYRKREINHEEDIFFGKGDRMGMLTFSDGRLLLLPVRSLQKLYYWITCPYIIERLNRDLKRTGKRSQVPDVGVLKRGTAIAKTQGMVHLEERELSASTHVKFDDIVQALQGFIPDEAVRSRLSDHLLVMSNEDFKWYANYGLPVLARNVLNKETKSSENVWYEEYLPVDTVMYSVVYKRKSYNFRPYLQLGANETVGQGWFRTAEYGGK